MTITSRSVHVQTINSSTADVNEYELDITTEQSFGPGPVLEALNNYIAGELWLISAPYEPMQLVTWTVNEGHPNVAAFVAKRGAGFEQVLVIGLAIA